MAQATKVGLRIDVDTFRGTKEGVPSLLAALDKHGIQASFFFSVGPDNMGRHIWRLFNPKFLKKMLLSNAPGLYGWDILLCGIIGSGPDIGKKLAPVIKAASRTHETGLHAWDHHAWQSHIEKWSDHQARQQIQLGVERLGDIIGRQPDCSAVAGWRCDTRTVDLKEEFGFRYNSDSRGDHPFVPLLASGKTGTPQIPVNLPTFDEVVGRETTVEGYNDYILAQMTPGRSHCYTIHAEVEGGIMADAFDRLLTRAKEQNIDFVPLGQLIEDSPELPRDRIIMADLPGREGWVGWQESSLA
ncbi:4-deoxy-4-formamido-L-arabinose-phosphoundecaprenol deformylase [Rhodovibrionaceae bacterium A322]